MTPIAIADWPAPLLARNARGECGRARSVPRGQPLPARERPAVCLRVRQGGEAHARGARARRPLHAEPQGGAGLVRAHSPELEYEFKGTN